jgi:uncharacterized protein YjbI with pentapeptide repeats/DNA-binding transcriptional regulator YiaG
MPKRSLRQRASLLVQAVRDAPQWRVTLWYATGLLLVLALFLAFAFPGGTWTNLAAEAAMLALTVVLVDLVAVRQNEEREKKDLILQMGGPDSTFTKEAVRKFRARGWLEHENGLLSGQDLSTANLSGADLSRANLSGADLSNANLHRTILQRTNLRGTNLHAAALTGAKLWRADLYTADLREADLRGANLSMAELSRANLTGADLFRADLRGASLNLADLGGADLREADLISTHLRAADLRGANLRRANLTGASPYRAQLTGANLGEAVLQGADLRSADLRGADLRQANLREAILSGADLFRADLHEADLRDADLQGANLASTDLFRANLTGANLHDAELRGANLIDAQVTDEQLAEAKTLEGATLPDGREYTSQAVLPAEQIPMIEAVAGQTLRDQQAGPPLLTDGSANTELKKAREQASLSQKALADLAGVSATTVSRWERRGKIPQSAELRARVAEILGQWPWPEDESVSE